MPQEKYGKGISLKVPITVETGEHKGIASGKITTLNETQSGLWFLKGWQFQYDVLRTYIMFAEWNIQIHKQGIWLEYLAWGYWWTLRSGGGCPNTRKQLWLWCMAGTQSDFGTLPITPNTRAGTRLTSVAREGPQLSQGIYYQKLLAYQVLQSCLDTLIALEAPHSLCALWTCISGHVLLLQQFWLIMLLGYFVSYQLWKSLSFTHPSFVYKQDSTFIVNSHLALELELKLFALYPLQMS